MKLLNNDVQTLAAAFTLGALSIGFAPVATAVSTYDANASFTFTLTGVTRLTDTQRTDPGPGPGPGPGFWDVTASGSGDVDLYESGVATATGSVSVVDPAVSLGIGSSITQSSSSSGSATNGIAATDAFTDLDITIENKANHSVSFSFAYEGMVDAATVGDADASARIDMLDELGLFDLQAFRDALSGPGGIDMGGGPLSFSDTFDMIIGPQSSNTISGFVDTYGSATAVPVPAAVWLFGTGLLGLIGVAKRKQAA
ncbi:MAG: VPLPA-CTERM sorting domain-containing protein [Gammaproteobacteria bacterium]